MTSLNDRMTLGHVVRVNTDGTVSDDTPGIYAPEVNIDYDGPFAEAQISDEQDAAMVADLKRQGWDVSDGWSGQYGYSGPIMHASECIGGALAEHILSTPGYWVAESVEIHPKETDPEYNDGNGESEAAGWVVMHRPFNEITYPAPGECANGSPTCTPTDQCVICHDAEEN